jgi:DNA-binding beta-propeller fold protein YncE
MGQDASRNVIYVVDVGNRTVRRLDQGTGQMTTMLRATDAMTAATAAGFSITGWEPHGVAANNEGIVYVSDAGNHVVWQYNANTGKLKLLAGRPGQPGRADGVGTAARFKVPGRMGISPDGQIANLVDTGNCLVRQISRNGTVASIGSGNLGTCTPLP